MLVSSLHSAREVEAKPRERCSLMKLLCGAGAASKVFTEEVTFNLDLCNNRVSTGRKQNSEAAKFSYLKNRRETGVEGRRVTS